jgi:hypothetical protein
LQLVNQTWWGIAPGAVVPQPVPDETRQTSVCEMVISMPMRRFFSVQEIAEATRKLGGSLASFREVLSGLEDTIPELASPETLAQKQFKRNKKMMRDFLKKKFK